EIVDPLEDPLGQLGQDRINRPRELAPVHAADPSGSCFPVIGGGCGGAATGMGQAQRGLADTKRRGPMISLCATTCIRSNPSACC
ncbi:MAG: hypothetical protein MUQ27_12120, partial [Acidimicrobiia bacterium]|nr:hypothetical protein [Acidimicrobiia bacterium]